MVIGIIVVLLVVCSLAGIALLGPILSKNPESLQQVVDGGYDAKVTNPAFTDRHPVVCFDQGHRNFHGLKGTYAPFVTLVESDGYVIRPVQSEVDAKALHGCDLLAIVTARRRTETEDAFLPQEEDAIVEWVHRGGSLFLVADVNSFAVAVRRLSARFGAEIRTGVAIDPTINEGSSDTSVLVFTGAHLADMPIARGRNRNERISKVIAFSGTSIKQGGPNAVLKISEEARYADLLVGLDEGGPKQGYSGLARIPGESQAVAFRFGKGRVYISADAGMFSAQEMVFTDFFGREVRRVKWGMNRDGYDNKQFTLNVLHWLCGLLD